MLDFELAEIYGYTTTKFNQQVKNNIEKFDEDFMFQLTKEDMLMTVLKGESAEPLNHRAEDALPCSFLLEPQQQHHIRHRRSPHCHRQQTSLAKRQRHCCRTSCNRTCRRSRTGKYSRKCHSRQHRIRHLI